MTLTGFAVCAHTFCAHKLMRARSYVVIPQIGIAMGFFANKNELGALSKGCRLWCWCCGPGCWCCDLAERAFKTGGGAAAAGVVSWQSAPVPVSAGCARCGGAVRWLCRLRTFLFQPIACQQVVGYCLAIWVYAGVIFLEDSTIYERMALMI